MRCPVDNAELVMTDRSGVEIDYCPQCRGVWLDRGELDKIIDRAMPAVPLPEPRRDDRGRDGGRDERPRGDGDRRGSGGIEAALGAVAGKLLGDGDRRRDRDDRREYGDKLDEWRERDEEGYRRRRKESTLGRLFDF